MHRGLCEMGYLEIDMTASPSDSPQKAALSPLKTTLGPCLP